MYFHSGFNRDHLVPVIIDLFKRLKNTGFRVIMGVLGHSVKQQIDMINKVLEPGVTDGSITGIRLWEISLSRSEESNTDHVAKWETSDMMFFYPGFMEVAVHG